jgi:predicted nucleotidyltransferase
MAILTDFGLIERAACSCVEQHPEVLAAYIFGSTAKGTTHGTSNLDIAVFASDAVIRNEDPLRYRLRLMPELMSALSRDDIDLVLLNQAPPLLAHRVLRDGKLIFERSPAARVRFRVKTVNRYLDTQPMRDFYLVRLKMDIQDCRGRPEDLSRFPAACGQANEGSEARYCPL